MIRADLSRHILIVVVVVASCLIIPGFVPGFAPLSTLQLRILRTNYGITVELTCRTIHASISPF